MSLDSLRQTIEVHLSTNFTSYPIKYENIPFDAPDNASWVACHIKRNILPTPELDTATYEIKGLLILQVFTPLNSGMVTSNTITNTLAGLYNNSKAIASLWFDDADITDVGKSDVWYQVNISVPFTFIGV